MFDFLIVFLVYYGCEGTSRPGHLIRRKHVTGGWLTVPEDDPRPSWLGAGAGAVAESSAPISKLEVEGIWVWGGLLKAQSHTCPNKAITFPKQFFQLGARHSIHEPMGTFLTKPPEPDSQSYMGPLVAVGADEAGGDYPSDLHLLSLHFALQISLQEESHPGTNSDQWEVNESSWEDLPHARPPLSLPLLFLLALNTNEQDTLVETR